MGSDWPEPCRRDPLRRGYWSCPEVSRGGQKDTVLTQIQGRGMGSAEEAESCRVNEDGLRGSSAHLRPLDLEGQKKGLLACSPSLPPTVESLWRTVKRSVR